LYDADKIKSCTYTQKLIKVVPFGTTLINLLRFNCDFGLKYANFIINLLDLNK